MLSAPAYDRIEQNKKRKHSRKKRNTRREQERVALRLDVSLGEIVSVSVLHQEEMSRACSVVCKKEEPTRP